MDTKSVMSTTISVNKIATLKNIETGIQEEVALSLSIVIKSCSDGKTTVITCVDHRHEYYEEVYGEEQMREIYRQVIDMASFSTKVLAQ